MNKNEPRNAPGEMPGFADSNDGAVVPSFDAQPLYTRQPEGMHPEVREEEDNPPDLPESPDDALAGLASSVEDGGLASYALAAAYEAVYHCDRCGRPIIEVAALAEGLAQHWGLDEVGRMSFEDALRRTGLELGNDFAPNFCSYHGQITSE